MRTACLANGRLAPRGRRCARDSSGSSRWRPSCSGGGGNGASSSTGRCRQVGRWTTVHCASRRRNNTTVPRVRWPMLRPQGRKTRGGCRGEPRGARVSGTVYRSGRPRVFSPSLLCITEPNLIPPSLHPSPRNNRSNKSWKQSWANPIRDRVPAGATSGNVHIPRVAVASGGDACDTALHNSTTPARPRLR